MTLLTLVILWRNALGRPDSGIVDHLSPFTFHLSSYALVTGKLIADKKEEVWKERPWKRQASIREQQAEA